MSDPEFAVCPSQQAPPLGGRWTVRLFGGFSVGYGARTIEHWPKRAVALLFARLLLQPQVAHGRDELAAWLWPVVAPRKDRADGRPAAVRRTRLRHTLSDLGNLLQRPGLPPDTAFIADRNTVQLNAAAFDTDVLAFEQALAGGELASAQQSLDRGLLPGWFDAWLDTQRARLSAAWAAAARAPAGATAQQLPAARQASALAALYTDSFFGRQAELAQLRAWLLAHRLVVVSGPGGCGKTRLVAQALDSLQGFDAVTFVALSPHREPAQLFEHIRDALQVQPGALPALEQVVARLAGQQALLVLDNFEQLVGSEAESALQALLQRLPQVHVLLTSVRGLRSAPAATLQLSALPVPDAGDGLRAAVGNAAVALFVDRAGQARAGFKLNARNRSDVIAACQALEGMPLAIELAAGRVRTLAPSNIAQALRQGAAVLARKGAKARKDARHASLQSVLDWSWGLLDAAQRNGVTDLAPLRGPFTVQQAQALADTPDIADLLQGLVRDSMLHPDAATGEPSRWRLRNAVREHALEKSPARRVQAARQRHRAYFQALAASDGGSRGLLGATDVPNLLAACEDALQVGDGAAATACALALARHGASHGAGPGLLDVLQCAALNITPDTQGHGALRLLLPPLFVAAGRAQTAQALAAHALLHAEAGVTARGEALLVRTHVAWLAGRDSAGALAPAREALRLARENGASSVQARALLLLGALTLTSGGDVQQAAVYFRQAESLFIELHDPRGEVLALPGLSACLLWQKNFHACIELARPGEALAAALGDMTTQLQLCNRLSEAHHGLNEFEQSLAVCQRQVRLARAHGMAYHIAYGLWNECMLLAQLRQPEKAALLMAFSRRYWETQFGPLADDDRRYVERVRRRVVAQIGRAAWRSAYDKGLSLDEAEGVKLGGG